MLSRRMFTGCAVCAAIGLAADDASAQAPSGIKRAITSRVDGPVEGYETLQVVVDLEPNFVLDWHTHPGTEAGYTVGGVGELRVKGKEAQMLKPGASWVTAAETPHMLQNGSEATKLFVTFTVQKGKPLSLPAPAPTE
ncbi:cupin domain-containing protein [Methylobacterium sp. E-046]|uniref:cupin domain-containing protein n=1 Tax=Methylobacterium sp. E-046 TaxID=2836576 RepID=UPI001FB9E63E|nr:cupin domain-containing protein [Methylobacterium sp. E-046]MCJ2103705.1 cupin domain-containing protein [Methylobacterium sp. E-046]